MPAKRRQSQSRLIFYQASWQMLIMYSPGLHFHYNKSTIINASANVYYFNLCPAWMPINFLMGNIKMSHDKTAPQAISISEIALAARLKKSPRTLLNWRKNGKTPPHFVRGRQVRYLIADIERFEIEHA
jgi:hypothetical protein